MTFDFSNWTPLSVLLTSLVTEEGAYAFGLASLQLQKISGWQFVLSYTAGILLGDFCLYSLGRLARQFRWVEVWPWLAKRLKSSRGRLVKSERLDEFLVLTRFLPGSRIPTYLLCGFQSYPLWKFFAVLGITGVLYSLVGVGLVTLLLQADGAQALGWPWQVVIAVTISLSVIFATKILSQAYRDWKHFGEVWTPFQIGIQRRLNGEFWSGWFFYLPFVPYYIGLLLKYRGFHGVLRSNPAIELSGVFGERKSDVQKLIEDNLPEKQLRLRALPTDLEQAKALIEREFTFPVVVKPDSGLRGDDVQVLKSLDSPHKWSDDKSWVAQEFCSFENEWGVFYIRDPYKDSGQIFSITQKVLPEVVGDGVSTLYQLVTTDRALRPRLKSLIGEGSSWDPEFVPRRGQKLRLSHRGSHSKGCLFLDGRKLMSPQIERQLVEAFDRIPKFYVGRVDIKFDSLGELAKGEFKVVEINGSGAESTNFYDPQYSLWQRYKIVATQWRTIFEIGKKSTTKHNQTASLLKFFKALFGFPTRLPHDTHRAA